jgi:hypothetical protein
MTLAAALILGASAPAEVEAQSATPYELRIHTCASPSYAKTDDPVYLTLQAGGRLIKMVLDDTRKNDRELNQTDSYPFAWPASIGGPSQLEQVKIELEGGDGWCFDSVELRYANQRLWQWTSSQNNAGRSMVGQWPTRGAIWLDDTIDAGLAAGSFVRFTDLGVSLNTDELDANGWYEAIYVGTCNATTSSTAGTSAPVDVTVMHNGVGDIITFPAGTFAQTASKGSRTVETFGTAVLEFSYTQFVDWISVTKHGGDDWCMETTGHLRAWDGVSRMPEDWHQEWMSPRQRFGAGTQTTRFDVRKAVRTACFPFCWNGACFKCQFRYQGLPLTKGDFNATLASCAEKAETCNGADDNCNGFVDEGLPRRNYYRDADDDGYGTSLVRNDCRTPGGYVTRSGDCNDASAAINPGTTETCNGIDDNCSGWVDEGVVNACGQCGPVPAELCNGVDDDCDGVIDDGFSNVPETCNGADDNCNGAIDENAVDVNACGFCGSLPVEICNGLDDNCNGLVDDAATDVNSCGVCGPQPTESCNLRDDDCDGQVDEDISLPTYCGYGVCQREGAIVCVEGNERDLCTPGQPTGDDSDCNGIDDDCDGEVDESFTPDIVQCLGDCGIAFLECRNGVVVNPCEACEG